MFFNVPCSAIGTITTPIEAKAITHVFFQPKNDRLWLADTDESGATVSIMIDGKQICKDLFILPFCTQSPTATCNFQWEDVAIEVNLNVNLSEIKITKNDSADYDTDDFDVVFVCSDTEVDESKGFEFFETKSITWCNDDVERNMQKALSIEYDNAVLALEQETADQFNAQNAEKNAANAKANEEREQEVNNNIAQNARNTLLNARNVILNEQNTELNKSISAHNAANAALRTALADTTNTDNVAAANAAFANLNTVNSALNTYNSTRNSENTQWNRLNAVNLSTYSIDPLPTDLKTDYSTTYPTNLGGTDAWPASADDDEQLAATDAKTDYPISDDITFVSLKTNYKTDYQATDDEVFEYLCERVGVRRSGVPDDADMRSKYSLKVSVNMSFGGEDYHYDEVYEKNGFYIDGQYAAYSTYKENYWITNKTPKANFSFDAPPAFMFAYNVMQISPAGRALAKQSTQFMKDNFVNSVIKIDGAESEVLPEGTNIAVLSATNHIPMRRAMYDFDKEIGIRKNLTVDISLPDKLYEQRTYPTPIKFNAQGQPTEWKYNYVKYNAPNNEGQIPIGDPCFWRTYFFFGYRKLA